MTKAATFDHKEILQMEIRVLEQRITSLAKEIKECNKTIALKRRALKNLPAL